MNKAILFPNLNSNCRWLYFSEHTPRTHQWSDWKMSASRYVSFHLSVLISSTFRNSQGWGEHKLSRKNHKEHFIYQQDVLLQAHICFSTIFAAYVLFCSILSLNSCTILFWFLYAQNNDLNKSQIFPHCFSYTVKDFRQKTKDANNPILIWTVRVNKVVFHDKNSNLGINFCSITFCTFSQGTLAVLFLGYFSFYFKLANKEKPLAKDGRTRISSIIITVFGIKSCIYRSETSAKIKVLKCHLQAM